MAGKKGKIPVDGGRAAWVTPFAGLSGEGLAAEAAAPAPRPAPADKAKVYRVLVRRETARRGGKTVMVVEGFPTHLSEDKLRSLLKTLQGGLGCGGTLNGRRMELQGEQWERLGRLLEGLGFSAKRGW